MLNYTLLRIAGLLGTLLIVSALTFGLMHAVPGGPFDARALEKQQIVPENIKRQLNEKYGLDKPVWQQYALFVRNAVFLDFGYSMAYPSRTVIEIFKQQWSYSLQLGLLTFIFSIIVGVGLGIASAIKKFKNSLSGAAETVRILTGLGLQTIASFIVFRTIKRLSAALFFRALFPSPRACS